MSVLTTDSHAHAQQVVECRPVHGGVFNPLDQRGAVHDDAAEDLFSYIQGFPSHRL